MGLTTTRLERFRSHKDVFFRGDPHSPLTPAQQAVFSGLAYFPEDPALRFELLLDRAAPSHAPIELATTGGQPQRFVPDGVVQLTIPERPVRLVVYRETGVGAFFCRSVMPRPGPRRMRSVAASIPGKPRQTP